MDLVGRNILIRPTRRVINGLVRTLTSYLAYLEIKDSVVEAVIIGKLAIYVS